MAAPKAPVQAAALCHIELLHSQQTAPSSGLSAAFPRGIVGVRTGRFGVSNTIYGIRNCDTMKKARAWLDAHGIAYGFHDYKAGGIDRKRLEAWAKRVGWETLLNRAGTTFRKLPDNDKQGLTEARAIALMLDQPSMIKRPVLELGSKIIVGFKVETYAAEVGEKK
jgi:Spx/MgsR family transcriptional regulator